MIYPQPAARRLRVYAFDPQAALTLGSVKYSYTTINLPWEELWDGRIEAGPINDYLEIVDYDPASKQFYAPVDLNNPYLLAQDGLTPSEGNPQFHQQMVFAVTMKTIKLFERALGRKIIWAPQWDNTAKTYVRIDKLRIYPHALREANAFYSKSRNALLFGYFRATNPAAGASWIFTALSHDVIAHEATHAILDGLHRRYSEPSSIDSLAFHEAFADIVALFSHFMVYEAVYTNIEALGGDLDESTILTRLAEQFGAGTTGRKSLRDYIDPSKKRPELFETAVECHERGAILVAAVFDAFLTIYKNRTNDLLRIAGISRGAKKALHPDLTARLAAEACKTADHVLRMCIRALDYLPPVDVRFGEFLRAVITADTDLIPDDRLNYRLAFIEGFRGRGILPENTLSMSPDNLLWEGASADLDTTDLLEADLNLMPEYDRDRISETAEINRRKVWYWIVQPELQVEGDADCKALTEQAKKVFGAGAAPEVRRAFITSIGKELEGLGMMQGQIEALRRRLSDPELGNPVQVFSDSLPPAVRFKRFMKTARSVFAGDEIAPDGSRLSPVAFVREQAGYLESLDMATEDIDALCRRLQSGDDHLNLWIAFLESLPTGKGVLACNETVDGSWETALGIYFRPETVRKRLNTIGWRYETPEKRPDLPCEWRWSGPAVEVHSVRTTRRSGPDGQDIRQLVIEVAQRRLGYIDEDAQKRMDDLDGDQREASQFIFRGGSTLIIDLRSGKLRYVIRKRIDDKKRLDTHRRYLTEPSGLGFTYDAASGNEPFAMIHRDH